MTIREELQDVVEDYALKTDDDIIDMLCEFGLGETEFHTADVERIIREKRAYEQKLNQILEAWSDVTTTHTQMGNLIKTANEYQ